MATDSLHRPATTRLLQACRDEDLATFAATLQAIVPEWQPGEGLARPGSPGESGNPHTPTPC